MPDQVIHGNCLCIYLLFLNSNFFIIPFAMRQNVLGYILAAFLIFGYLCGATQVPSIKKPAQLYQEAWENYRAGSLEYARKVLNAFPNSDIDPVWQVKAKILEGHIALAQNEPATALDHKSQASNLIREKDLEFLEYDRIHSLEGDIYFYLERHFLAKKAYEDALDILEKNIIKTASPPDSLLGELNHRKAVNYSNMGHTMLKIEEDSFFHFLNNANDIIEVLINQNLLSTNSFKYHQWKVYQNYYEGSYFVRSHQEDLVDVQVKRAFRLLSEADSIAEIEYLTRPRLLINYQLGKLFSGLDARKAINYFSTAVNLEGEKLKDMKEYGWALQGLKNEYLYLADFENRFKDNAEIRIYLDSLEYYERLYDQWINDLNKKYIRNLFTLSDNNKNVIKSKNLQLEAKNIELVETNKELEKRGQFLLILSIINLLFGAGVIYLFFRARENKILKAKNQELQKEKELSEYLKGEMHHRVKNHLQILASTMKTQMRDQIIRQNLTATSALNEAINRVQTILLLHNQLYKKKASADSIDLQEYFVDLSLKLKESFAYDDNNFFSDIDLNELPPVHIGKAKHLGMAVTELAINAFKHAFDEKHRPWLKIAATQNANDLIHISVADKGKGIQRKEKQNFGLSTTIEIIEQQFEGQFICQPNNGQGTRFDIKIPFKSLKNGKKVK